jgi:hypothetical protein
MRFTLTTARGGIIWVIWSRDFNEHPNSIIVAMLRLWWGKRVYMRRLVWDSDYYGSGQARIAYHTEDDSKRAGWCLQAPVQKLY